MIAQIKPFSEETYSWFAWDVIIFQNKEKLSILLNF